jgi:hypothetical protein
VFNNIYLDKFTVYDYLSTDNELVSHVPHTILYKTGGDIFNMLNLHGKVYVKPRAGTKGIGVVSISLEGGRIAFRYREANNNMEKFFDRPSECREYIEQLFTPNSYVIQQSVEVLTYEGRVTDFRLMIQKDSKGIYVCKGITARIGAPGSVVSNVYSGGDSVWGRDLLKKMLNFTEHETFSMLESMKSFGLKICSALAEMGVQYGDLGFDIGIDKNLRLWLIEINSLCPDPKAALTVNDIELYKDLLSTPLFYARFLSGFRE